MSLAAKLLAPPLLVLTLVAGVWFLGAFVAPSTRAAIGLGVAWLAVCAALAWRAGRAWPGLRPWLRGTVLAGVVVGSAGFWWTTVRETEVDERIVTGVPASKVPAGELGPVDPLAPQP